MYGPIGAERRERPTGHILPIGKQPARRRIAEQQAKEVGLAAIKLAKEANNYLGRPVPRQHVPTPAKDEGGLSGETIDHVPKWLADLFVTRQAPLWRGGVVQQKKMVTIGGIEPRHFGERDENLPRRLYLASLFEPSVPSGPDTG